MQCTRIKEVSVPLVAPSLSIIIRFDRQNLVICAEYTAGGAEGIYEFDVRAFCAACRAATGTL